MERRYAESNLPSGTWESVWVNLIIRATEEWRNGYYIDSWKTTLQLYAWLPKECKADVKAKVEGMKKEVETRIHNASAAYASLRAVERGGKLQRYLAQPLLELHADIQDTLESHDWICKGAGATPQVKHAKPARF